MRHARLLVRLVAGVVAVASSAHADPPNGAALLRMLGPRAQVALAPRASTIGAVVRVPPGLDPASVGLAPYSPGFARLRGTSDELLGFSTAHPELPFEVAFPPHLLLDKVGQWTHATVARAQYDVYGDGVLVGVADTGVDFTLDDFADPMNPGKTRIAWLLDLTCPTGCPHVTGHEDLEAKYGGYVYSGDDLETLLGQGMVSGGAGQALTDDVGHGTHVSSIAAGNGGLARKYVGIAPNAGLVIARITEDEGDDLDVDDLLTGVQFLFDRADFMKMPIAVNLSLGSDFGSHDGLMAWEQALAAFVGPSYPGRALVVAAGNSGDIAIDQVHASVYVAKGTTQRVPITSLYGGGRLGGGQIQVWITMRQGASLSVGIDAPSGTWIAPVGANATGSYSTTEVTAGVDVGSGVSDGQIPAGSDSALAIWSGTFPAGTYGITLTGEGVADLYVEGTDDSIDDNGNGVGFVDPVREGTVNIPATNAGLIAVGCTVNKPSWTSIAGGYVTVAISPLDPRGGYALDSGLELDPIVGDVCWFSSAGPTVTGVPKPEISAPGGIVVAALSSWAIPSPSNPNSIFDNPDCPSIVDGGAPSPVCMQVDSTHAVAAGTSMSAPQAAGTAALLFEKDPTLTQDKILALLQAGSHGFRIGTPRFEDQGGPGEIDVAGSLDALEQMQNPYLALPSAATSWVTLSADEVTADGSTPITAIVELRTADGAHRADYFDASRLAPVLLLDGAAYASPPAIQRRGPGVWFFTLTPPAGLGGSVFTFGATFDGEPIVATKSVPVATDVWTANYPASASGSCALGHSPRGDSTFAVGCLVALCLVLRRRRHSPRSETTQPCPSGR